MELETFKCDLCGADDPAEIESAVLYTGGQPLHVCKSCGFIYARQRRPEQAIADSWSDVIFGSGNSAALSYTARIPWVIGRLTFVAEFVHQSIDLKNKSVAEIGAGEGVFLDLVRQPQYGATVYGIEPSKKNCATLREQNIPAFCGTIGSYLASEEATKRKFDVVAMLWTLECCRSARQMLDATYEILKPGGHVLVATGSRILVPFKKPLHYFLSKNPLDTHPIHFSFNTLRGMLASSSFEMAHVNRYIDNDLMIMIGQKREKNQKIPWEKDDWRAVRGFFDRWHRDTQEFFAKT